MISALTRSSPGSRCLSSTSASSISTTASDASFARAYSSGVEVGREQRGEPPPERRPIGLGHAEQLADDGERQRERERRRRGRPRPSGPRAAMASSRSSTMRLHARARAPRSRRTENAAETSRRSRVWSGGSTASMCRANAGPGSPSATTSPPAASAACMSLDSRGSLSARAGLLVADDEPGVVPVGERHRRAPRPARGLRRTAGTGRRGRSRPTPRAPARSSSPPPPPPRRPT